MSDELKQLLTDLADALGEPSTADDGKDVLLKRVATIRAAEEEKRETIETLAELMGACDPDDDSTLIDRAKTLVHAEEDADLGAVLVRALELTDVQVALIKAAESGADLIAKRELFTKPKRD